MKGIIDFSSQPEIFKEMKNAYNNPLVKPKGEWYFPDDGTLIANYVWRGSR